MSRLKGKITNERGEAIANADVRAEALYGSAAGTFAGQRTFTARSGSKGDWNILGIAPGVWVFEVFAPGYLPEVAAIPIRLLTASSPNAGGSLITWDLILKPVKLGDDESGKFFEDLTVIARDREVEKVRSSLERIAGDSDADFLAAAGRIAFIARDYPLAQTLFKRSLDRDPASYRAALGIASVFLAARDFDSASRAFDATRSRTHDKDEQKWLSAAIGDLATIKIR